MQLLFAITKSPKGETKKLTKTTPDTSSQLFDTCYQIQLLNHRITTRHSSISFHHTNLNSTSHFLPKYDGCTGFVDPDGKLPYDQLMLNSISRSSYGFREHPITKALLTFHKGVDLISQEGSVRSAGRGIVSNVRFQFDGEKGWGNFVDIKHFMPDGSLYKTRYAHLKELPNLKVGEVVNEGHILGQMGATGGATGPHLHFEMYKYDFGSKSWNVMDPTLFNVGQFDSINELNNFVGPPKSDGTY